MRSQSGLKSPGSLAVLGMSMAVLAVARPHNPRARGSPRKSGRMQGSDPTLEEWEVPWEQSRRRAIPTWRPTGGSGSWASAPTTPPCSTPSPASSRSTTFPTEPVPHTVVVGTDGIVWYNRQPGSATWAGSTRRPATSRSSRCPTSAPATRTPSPSMPRADLWFTVQGGNMVGKFWRETGDVRLVEMPDNPEGRGGSTRPLRPEDGLPRPALGRRCSARTSWSWSIRRPSSPPYFELPDGARPRRLVIDSSDIVWYVDYARGYLGRVDPETGEVTEWANPSGEEARP